MKTIRKSYVVAQHPDNPDRFFSRRETDGNAMRPASDDPDGFGPIEQALLGDPLYCRKPTDMTWNPGNFFTLTNPDYEALLRCRLVPVTITTIYEVIES